MLVRPVVVASGCTVYRAYFMPASAIDRNMHLQGPKVNEHRQSMLTCLHDCPPLGGDLMPRRGAGPAASAEG